MKHTPIPEQLWGSGSSDECGMIHIDHLPCDLARLFKAAPKLADACRDLLQEAEHSPGPPHSHVCLEAARAALALLEE